jgi:hypothetical protein
MIDIFVVSVLALDIFLYVMGYICADNVVVHNSFLDFMLARSYSVAVFDASLNIRTVIVALLQVIVAISLFDVILKFIARLMTLSVTFMIM